MDWRGARVPILTVLNKSCAAVPSKSRSRANLWNSLHPIPSSRAMPSWGPSVAKRSWLGTGKADSVAIKRQVEPEAARDASPPAFHKVDSVCGAIQTRRESERTSFVCRGRRTVEQRKKQAELSAISCFLGLALSFLRGGSGRFVLVPSCTSAPLSSGLRRPRRNAAFGPQGTWLRAPPQAPNPGAPVLARYRSFCQPLLGLWGRGEPPQRGFLFSLTILGGLSFIESHEECTKGYW